MKIFFKSDFVIEETITGIRVGGGGGSGSEMIDLTAIDVIFEYFTDGKTVYCASKIGDVYKNCRFVPPNKIEVFFKCHNLSSGILRREIAFKIPIDFGFQNLAVAPTSDVTLVSIGGEGAFSSEKMKIPAVNGGGGDFKNFYTKEEINEMFGNYYDVEAVDAKFSDYYDKSELYTKTETDNLINSTLGDINSILEVILDIEEEGGGAHE